MTKSDYFFARWQTIPTLLLLSLLAGCNDNGAAQTSSDSANEQQSVVALRVNARKRNRVSTNNPPTISGSPATSVTVGQSYGFTPVGADADGNVLDYSISNKPVWATFSTATGRLSGTPGAADVGNYSNIVISVSDGVTSVSLPAFTLAVTQSASGSATLSWAAPTENTDGSALTDLAGYRIYYGNSSSSMTQTVQIPTVGLTIYQVAGLGSGTWYFAIKAYNSSGAESNLSNVASKIIS